MKKKRKTLPFQRFNRQNLFDHSGRLTHTPPYPAATDDDGIIQEKDNCIVFQWMVLENLCSIVVGLSGDKKRSVIVNCTDYLYGGYGNVKDKQMRHK